MRRWNFLFGVVNVVLALCFAFLVSANVYGPPLANRGAFTRGALATVGGVFCLLYLWLAAKKFLEATKE